MGPLTIKRNIRARRMILRVSRTGAVVTVPRRVSEREVMRFVARHEDWLHRQQQALPQSVPFAPGAVIPFQGEPHLIRLSGSLRGRVERISPALSPLPVGEGKHCLGSEASLVMLGEGLFSNVSAPHPNPLPLGEGTRIITLPCLAEHVSRRLKDYLKNEARIALSRAVTKHTSALGLRPPALSLRDTTSRWGSCSPRGALSFSWRLILAPPEILDYVAAHEVAHIREMNHGANFWRLCAELVEDIETPRAWLKQHGQDLHRYG